MSTYVTKYLTPLSLSPISWFVVHYSNLQIDLLKIKG